MWYAMASLTTSSFISSSKRSGLARTGKITYPVTKNKSVAEGWKTSWDGTFPPSLALVSWRRTLSWLTGTMILSLEEVHHFAQNAHVVWKIPKRTVKNKIIQMGYAMASLTTSSFISSSKRFGLSRTGKINNPVTKNKSVAEGRKTSWDGTFPLLLLLYPEGWH